MPSVLVRIVPLRPTATNMLLLYVILFNSEKSGDVCFVQDIPSVLVRIIPLEPTATNMPLPYVTSSAVP